MNEILTALVPTLREETIHLVEHANIDLEYARKQLSNAQSAGNRRTMQDCISRAQDALERVADAHAQIVIAQAETTLPEPEEGMQIWTLDDILAREG